MMTLLIGNLRTFFLKLFKVRSLPLLLLASLAAEAQCDVLKWISDTTDFQGVTIFYVSVDSQVTIQYETPTFENNLGEEYSFSCSLSYMPGIPRPVWRNDDFVCFRSGCGTSCFGNFLAPLSNDHKAEYAGQFVVDTSSALFISFLLDTISFEPYLFIKEYSTGKEQKEPLSTKDFPGAIPFMNLDFERGKSAPYRRKGQYLVLRLQDMNELRVRLEI